MFRGYTAINYHWDCSRDFVLVIDLKPLMAFENLTCNGKSFRVLGPFMIAMRRSPQSHAAAPRNMC